MALFEEYASNLSPHPSKARILLEVNSEGQSLERALNILRGLGIHRIRVDRVKKKPPELVVLLLSTDDMREAVLRLSEAGFLRLKGVNPAPGSKMTGHY